jgi:predicted aspartyl protease
MTGAHSIKLLHTHPLLVVSAKINGRGPFRFSVDTGASITVVTPAVVKLARIKNNSNKVMTAVSANTRASTVLAQIDTLQVGNLTVTSLDVAVMNLATVNRATHLGLGGILGYNFLTRYRVTIDYRRNLLTLQA